MAGNIRWEGDPGGLTTAITAANLNALADNAIEYAGSQVIDNEDANHDTFMDLKLELGSIDLSAQTNPCVVIYMIESVDGGTDYDTAEDANTADDEMPAADKIVAIFGLRPNDAAEAKVAHKTMIPIPPVHFKLALRNKTGVTLAASDTTNTLEYRTYQMGYT